MSRVPYPSFLCSGGGVKFPTLAKAARVGHPAGRRLALRLVGAMNEAAGHDRRDWFARELPAVERRIA